MKCWSLIPDGRGTGASLRSRNVGRSEMAAYLSSGPSRKGHDGSVAGVWCVHTDNPDDQQPQWSQPRRLTDGIMMCKPVVLSTGEWVLPASTWRATDSSARMIVSTTLGRNWSLRGACNVPQDVRAFDEHIITERQDGSLWLLARTKYGIGESISTDRGKTWPDLTPSAIAHPSARFFVRRLQSGNLLLVKHGAIDQRTGRSHLTAFVSSDEGRSLDWWSAVGRTQRRLLPGRSANGRRLDPSDLRLQPHRCAAHPHGHLPRRRCCCRQAGQQQRPSPSIGQRSFRRKKVRTRARARQRQRRDTSTRQGRFIWNGQLRFREVPRGTKPPRQTFSTKFAGPSHSPAAIERTAGQPWGRLAVHPNRHTLPDRAWR
jgi:hypothetical protein